jgi:hypothetical protein
MDILTAVTTSNLRHSVSVSFGVATNNTSINRNKMYTFLHTSGDRICGNSLGRVCDTVPRV